MKRIFDLFLALALCLILFLPMLIICVLLKLTSEGPIIHWSQRIGRKNKIFMMPKFRTMLVKTPQVATHLLLDEEKFLTNFGAKLRKSSLDELPQLFSILKGDMSFVGPRPALFNQNDLRDLRTRKGIEGMRPGLTGLAQINGRDQLSIEEKVEFDNEYMKKMGFWFDFFILVKTVLNVINGRDVRH